MYWFYPFFFAQDSETEDNVIVKWRNDNGLFIPSDVEIPQYDLSNVKAKNNRGVYTTGLLGSISYAALSYLKLLFRFILFPYSYFLDKKAHREVKVEIVRVQKKSIRNLGISKIRVILRKKKNMTLVQN